MVIQERDLTTILRLIVQHTMRCRFPTLPRPPIPSNKPATKELVSWGVRAYCYSWLRHFSILVNGIITLKDAGNTPSAIIVARSSFELGAHAYYVKKHLKQHIDSNDLDGAWKFLGPIRTGSRYMNEQNPEESKIFPDPSHVSKVIRCFSEKHPKSEEDYSFISEYCHPNMFAFSQHYRWPNPFEIQFVDHEPQGWLGSTTSACISGLVEIEDLLLLVRENAARPCLVNLLRDIAKRAQKEEGTR